VPAEVAEAVERFRGRGIIGCDVRREPGEGRVFFLVKLEADKVDDVMNDSLAFAGARDHRIYVYRRHPDTGAV
jgi:uroporphyrinogen-III synthase